MVVTRKDKMYEVMAAVKEIDNKSFFTVSTVMGVYGEGFEEFKAKKKAKKIARDEKMRAQKKAAAMRTAELAAAEQIQAAKKESEEILSKAYASARQERQRIVDDAGRKIAEVAAAAAEQLTRKAYGSAYNLFLDTVEAEGGVFDEDEEES